MPADKDNFLEGVLLSAEGIEELLNDWVLLNDQLMSLSAAAVRQLLIAEANGRKRQAFLRRLFGRYNKLRGKAEMEAILRGRLWPIVRD